MVEPFLAFLLAAQAPAAVAPEPDWGRARLVSVALSNFDYTPATVRMPAGVPVRLRLTNAGSGGHNFSSPAFFAAARLDSASAARVRRGAVELRGRSTVEIRLVPAAGRYRLRCTHLFHSAFGMTGEILVE